MKASGVALPAGCGSVTLILVLLTALAADAQTNVLTYHNDNEHTGRYLGEILLAPANVNAAHFGSRHLLVTDGPVYAQPLYLSRVKIAGQGLRNVVFVVTSHDSVYAFDADDQLASDPLWMVNFLDEAHGVNTLTQADVGCTIPELGTIGTPVIDAGSGTIYLIAETKESGNQAVFRLHALDVTNGAERPGSPVEIQPPDFVPLAQKHRTSLLLLNGVIYSSWSGHCDQGTYHGWVMAHDAKTLKLAGVFNSTAGGSGASFWNGGAGPAADAEGNIYVVSANGDVNGVPSPGGNDEAVMKLAPAPHLAVLDRFVPFNKETLNESDLDLGSSGALVLPDEAGSAAHPHLVFTAGKEGRMYLLDREALGGPQNGSDFNALASLPVLAQSTFGTAAYFNGSIYVTPELSPMFAFRIGNGSLASSPAAQTSDTLPALGATPSISANGDKNGIVWVTVFTAGGELAAYDATSLRKLYDSTTQSDSPPYTFTEFTAPTIADGKVFVPSYFGVVIYGERANGAPKVTAVTDGAAFAPDAIAPGSLISIFGSGFAAATASASSTPLPLSIGDVSVTINGIPAPVLFVSPKQINVQVPYEVAAAPASLVVRVHGMLSAPMAISLKPAAPALFTDINGQAAAVDIDGSANSPQSPAVPGSFISLFFTGQGPVAAAIDDGDAPAAGSVIPATLPISATIGGVPAEVQFAGLAPSYPGLAQINLKIPTLAPGVYPVVVTIAGVASNAAQVAVSAP
jgi:uncharacterized protein (TIGR03437 family)